MKALLIIPILLITGCTPIRLSIGEPTELRQQEAQLIVVETIKAIQAQTQRAAAKQKTE